jgi:hypothetical protein
MLHDYVKLQTFSCLCPFLVLNEWKIFRIALVLVHPRNIDAFATCQCLALLPAEEDVMDKRVPGYI